MYKRIVFCMACVVFLLGFAGVSNAELIGIQPGFPVTMYNAFNALDFNSVSGEFSVKSIPLFVRFSPTEPPRTVTGTKSVSMKVVVDSSGYLVSGSAGDDFIFTGDIDSDGDGIANYSGVLLRGEVVQFGHVDTGGPTDLFDLRFAVSGGALASLYAGKDIGVMVTSEASTFTGDFSVNFKGNAKGIFGPVDAICTLQLVVEGCVQLPPAPEPVGSDCEGKLKELVLEYTGEGCEANFHSQDDKKAYCSGDAAGENDVTVIVTDKSGKKIFLSQTGVSVGDQLVVTAVAADPGKKSKGKDKDKEKESELKAETKVTVINSQGEVIQEILFHTSCSQPLNVGDQFGSMRVVSLTSTKGGEIVEEIPDPNEVEEVCITVLPSSLPMPVVYSYTVSNDGGVFPITNISVIDEVFGEVPGSPITSLAPDESVTLTLTATLSDEQTNVATAVGHVILGLCETSGEATITRAELPVLPGECESKLKSLLLKYIGPDIADATVVFVTDTFDTPVIYAGVNLVNGTILSLPTENGYTIDASAHGETDLGPKLTILINNVPEVIHTSCSVPVYRQAPAPLNEPKGAPSPNWFVLEFDEKN